jgi:hypothetical protein
LPEKSSSSFSRTGVVVFGEKGDVFASVVCALVAVEGSALMWEAGGVGFVAVVAGGCVVVGVVCGAVAVAEGTVEGVVSTDFLGIDIVAGAGSIVAIVPRCVECYVVTVGRLVLFSDQRLGSSL